MNFWLKIQEILVKNNTFAKIISEWHFIWTLGTNKFDFSGNYYIFGTKLLKSGDNSWGAFYSSIRVFISSFKAEKLQYNYDIKYNISQIFVIIVWHTCYIICTEANKYHLHRISSKYKPQCNNNKNDMKGRDVQCELLNIIQTVKEISL